MSYVSAAQPQWSKIDSGRQACAKVECCLHGHKESHYQCSTCMTILAVVWLSGSALVLINVVALRLCPVNALTMLVGTEESAMLRVHVV